MQTFDSGVIVLKSSSITEEEYRNKIVYLVEAFQKISADQLAKVLYILWDDLKGQSNLFILHD